MILRRNSKLSPSRHHSAVQTRMLLLPCTFGSTFPLALLRGPLPSPPQSFELQNSPASHKMSMTTSPSCWEKFYRRSFVENEQAATLTDVTFSPPGLQTWSPISELEWDTKQRSAALLASAVEPCAPIAAQCPGHDRKCELPLPSLLAEHSCCNFVLLVLFHRS